MRFHGSPKMLTASLLILAASLAGCGDGGQTLPSDVLPEDAFFVQHVNLQKITPERIDQTVDFYHDILDDEGVDEIGGDDIDEMKDTDELTSAVESLRDAGVQGIVRAMAPNPNEDSYSHVATAISIKAKQDADPDEIEEAIDELPTSIQEMLGDYNMAEGELDEVNDRWFVVTELDGSDMMGEVGASSETADRINQYLQRGGDRAIRLAFAPNESIKARMKEDAGDGAFAAEMVSAVKGAAFAFQPGEQPEAIAILTAINERRAHQLHGLYDGSMLWGRTMGEIVPIIVGMSPFAPNEAASTDPADPEIFDRIEQLLQPEQDDATLTLNLTGDKMKKLTQQGAKLLKHYQPLMTND